MQIQSQHLMNFRTAHTMDCYEKAIVPLLKEMANQKLTKYRLIKILQEFYYHTHPRRQKGSPQNLRFDSLTKLYQNETLDIFSQIAKYMLKHKKFTFPVLESNKQQQITFTKGQIFYLVCSMALNLLPFQQFEENIYKASRFPYRINFSFIFFKEQYKTKAIMEYFKYFFQKISGNKEQLQEKLTIRRQRTSQNIDELIKSIGSKKMQNFEVVGNEKSIEDYNGHIKVDFANKFIGGGALHTGCVQEEIMFANRPQIMTSMLFCQVMQPNESLFFIGFKKYIKNSGYGWTTQYDGLEDLKYKKDEQNRAKQYITAIDALHFASQINSNQMSKQNIDRQILKAFTGFNVPEKADIITGNWGCGAFNGQIKCKFLIQWIACSLAGKKMIYCPFGAQGAILQNQTILNQLNKMTVGQVYKLLMETGPRMNNMRQNIFQLIQQLIQSTY